MQNNEYCYKFDSKTKTKTLVKLQSDHMNGGFMPKPDDSLYEEPSVIGLEEHETLKISSDVWIKIPWYIGVKLYHKIDKTEIEITEVGKQPSDYQDYTIAEITDQRFAYYYDFSVSGWVFNLTKYKIDACNRVTALSVNANYTMFSQYKRDNVYAGSPVTDNYPDYLIGDAGKRSIAKLNAVYQQIAANAQTAIQSVDITTKEEVNAIIDALVFPTEAEILTQIKAKL